MRRNINNDEILNMKSNLNSIFQLKKLSKDKKFEKFLSSTATFNEAAAMYKKIFKNVNKRDIKLISNVNEIMLSYFSNSYEMEDMNKYLYDELKIDIDNHEEENSSIWEEWMENIPCCIEKFFKKIEVEIINDFTYCLADEYICNGEKNVKFENFNIYQDIIQTIEHLHEEYVESDCSEDFFDNTPLCEYINSDKVVLKINKEFSSEIINIIAENFEFNKNNYDILANIEVANGNTLIVLDDLNMKLSNMLLILIGALE